jgi:acyl dehydratase
VRDPAVDTIKRPACDLRSLAREESWYADDLAEGDWMDLGRVTVSARDIVEFAERYDPLPLHVDPVAAAASPFGGLIASAMHTLSLYAGMASRTFIPRLALVAGKGIDTTRFPNPVRPDSTLTGRVEILRIETRPGRADVHSFNTMDDQTGTRVLEFVGITVVRRREREANEQTLRD